MSMRVGIGLPGHAPWTDGRAMLDWARRAEDLGFSSVAVSDRLAWSTPEPLTTLAAVAGATTRIGLLSSVLLGGLRTNHALFAKAVTTVDQLAGPGRLRLGLAAGMREDDFALSDADFSTRGKQLDALVDRLVETNSPDSTVGPAPATEGGPGLLFGGMSPATVRRIARHGAGWILGDATPEAVTGFRPELEEAWHRAGRVGTPPVVAAVMFALGPDAGRRAREAIVPYYAFAGVEYAEYGAAAALTSPARIAEAVEGFREAGCDELLFTGNDPDPGQVELLADALDR